PRPQAVEERVEDLALLALEFAARRPPVQLVRSGVEPCGAHGVGVLREGAGEVLGCGGVSHRCPSGVGATPNGPAAVAPQVYARRARPHPGGRNRPGPVPWGTGRRPGTGTRPPTRGRRSGAQVEVAVDE